jgi:hypothetical protein
MFVKIKKWISDHPYLLTSVVFLIILYVGWRVLYWRDANFAFLLLLYLIVTMGIRLDDISRKISTRAEKSSQNPDDRETIMNQLNNIKDALLSINATLDRILEKTDKDDH